MLKKKFRICPPIKTIENIKYTLDKFEIIVKEKQWWNKNTLHVPCSVSLKLHKLPFFSYGKGITSNYALASAYGEIMERIQNFNMLNLHFGLNESDNHYLKATDRKISDNSLIMKWRQLKIASTEVINAIADIYKEKKVHAVKYFHVNTGNIEYLPEYITTICTGSNGMCSGNTIEEALVQGLCEILERFILQKLYDAESLELPCISEKVLKTKPSLYNYYTKIRKFGYDLLVKDCSLGGKYPVVGIVIKKGELATFNLGSAPTFEVALERCFTEILQATNIGDLKKILSSAKSVVSFNRKQKSIYWKTQLNKSYSSYSGTVKSNLLKIDNYINDKIQFFYFSGKTIHDTLENILSIFAKNKWQIYIRDSSYLGFPAFHIYVPHVSQVGSVVRKDIVFASQLPQAISTMLSLGVATMSEIKALIETINYFIKQHELFTGKKDSDAILMFKFLQIPKVIDVNINVISSNIILCFLYFYLEKYYKALEMLYQEIKSNGKSSSRKIVVNCLKDIIAIKIKNKKYSRKEILQKYKKKYSEDMCLEVFEVLQKPQLLSDYLIKLKQRYENRNIVPFCLKLQKNINKFSFDQLLLQKTVRFS